MVGIVDPATIATDADFAGELVVLRTRSGCSIRRLSRITEIPPATLGGYFSGRHLPPVTQPQVLEDLLAGLGVTDPVEIAGWREALHRVRRGAGGRGWGPCPYRGLEPFTDADHELFFGREQVVADLVDEVDRIADGVQTPRMLVLVGASGSGKSSTLRAGLVAQMRKREYWAATAIVPGSDPLASLRQAQQSLTGSQHALLVVDQAEEIFSPLVPGQVRRDFITGLLELAGSEAGTDSIVVVAALRADFYGQAAAEPDLLPVLRNHQVLLGAMDLDDLRRAVVQPATKVGVQVDAELVQLLVHDLHPRGNTQTGPGYNAGALPLVSHALLAAWTHHRGQHLSVTDYLNAGGIAGAVQQSAEAAVATLDEQGRIAAQWLFTQLVIVDDDAAMTRRRINHEDLHHPDPDTDLALDDVIEAFVSARLLTADDRTLEISHEALLTAWPRLREWVLTDLDSARLQQRIADAAAAWRERDQDPGALLRGATLADAQALAARPLTSTRILTAGQMQYVAASSAQASAEATAAHRRTRRLQALLAIMTVLAIAAATMTAVTQRALNDANTARDEALSRQLAITADRLRGTDPALAAQLSLAAYQTSATIQARSSLLDSTAVTTPTRFVGPPGDMHAVASPDGRTLAVSGSDGKTRLWQMTKPPAHAGELPQYQPAGQLDSGSGPVYASTFSPDGQLLAVSGNPGKVTLWDSTGTPTRVADLDTNGATVYALAFNHDGTQLAAATSQPSVHRWKVTPSKEPKSLPTITTGFTRYVHAVAYHPRTDIIAAASEGGELTTWTSPRSGIPQPLGTAITTDPDNWVLSLAFSPDGEQLATGQKNGTVGVFDLSNPRSPKKSAAEYQKLGSWVNSVAYSPDGRELAAASSDGYVHTYRTNDAVTTARLPGPGAFTAVQYTSHTTAPAAYKTAKTASTAAAPTAQSTRMLLTAEVSGTARLWPLPGPSITGFYDSIWNVIAPSNSRLLAVSPGRGDGHIYLYDNTNPANPRVLDSLSIPTRAGQVSGSLALSPDGRWIAAGTAVGRVALWNRHPQTGDITFAGVAASSKHLIDVVEISDDGNKLAAMDGTYVRVWDLRPNEAPRLKRRLAVPGMPLALAFSPDASLLAVGTTSARVHVWRLSAQGSVIGEQPSLSGFENYATSLSFDPTGRYLAAGSMDRTVRIFNLTDPQHPSQVGNVVRGPQDTVGFLDWSPKGDRLAGAIVGGTVWVWDVSKPATPQHLATLGAAEGRLFTTTFSPDGTSLYAAGANRTVNHWNVEIQTILESTCQRTGTPMSQAEWQRWVPDVDFIPPCSTQP